MKASYHVNTGLTAIRLANSQLGQRNGTFATIPAGALIQLLGNSDSKGMVEIVWDGHPYALFLKDLEQRAEAD